MKIVLYLCIPLIISALISLINKPFSLEDDLEDIIKCKWSKIDRIWKKNINQHPKSG